MAEWAYVENNEIVELHDILPVSWRNISGLRNAADNIEFLNSVGWYKVNKQPGDFNTDTHYVSDHNYEFTNNTVIETDIIIEKPSISINIDNKSSSEKKEDFFIELRRLRDSLLVSSDWTQLNDVESIMGKEQQVAWSNYRQQLRDLPNVYEQLYTDDLNISSIIWPTVNITDVSTSTDTNNIES